MSFKVKLIGVKKINKAFKKMEKAHPMAARAALFNEAQDMGFEIYPLIPIDTGELRASFGITPPIGRRAIFIGVGVPYGVHVHERTDLNHKAPTQAKFIEVVWNRRKGALIERVGETMKRYRKVKWMSWRKVPTLFPLTIKG
jgi:hypothetical protein